MLMGPAQREQRAADLIGRYEVKTAGGILIDHGRHALNGWLYASAGHLLFIADEPLVDLPDGFPGWLDDVTVLLPITERPPHRLTAPALAPNGIVAFTDGVSFIGQKSRIAAVSDLVRASRA